MSNWRERVEAELARIATDEATKKLAVLDEEKRKAEEIKRKIAEVERVAQALDSLRIDQALEEINRDVWGRKGQVTQPVTLTTAGVVSGKEFRLQARVPQDVLERTEPVVRQVYGKYTVSGREAQYGHTPVYTYRGWHKKHIADRVVEPEVVYREHLFYIGYRLDDQTDFGRVYACDNNFPLPRFQSEKVIGTQAYRTDEEVGLSFATNAFDLDLAKAFIDNALFASSVARLQRPIEPYYLRAEAELARIKPRVGILINQDPVPFWKRILS